MNGSTTKTQNPKATPCAVPAPDAPTDPQSVGLEACYQAEALLRMLLVASHGDVDELPFLVRSTVPRLLVLTGISVSAHDPDTYDGDTDALLNLLHAGCAHLLAAKKGSAA